MDPITEWNRPTALERLAVLEIKLEETRSNVKEIKGSVQYLVDKHNQTKGMAKVGQFMWTGLSGVIGAGAYAVWQHFTFHPK